MGIGVVAAAEDSAGALVGTGQIGCSGQITLTTVAIVTLVILAITVVPIVGACRKK